MMTALLGLSQAAVTAMTIIFSLIIVVQVGVIGWLIIRHREHVAMTELGKPAKKKRYRSMKAKRITVLTIIHIVLTVLAIVWVLPFVYVVLHSFRANDPLSPFPAKIIPTEWTLDAWARLFNGKPEAYSDAKFAWVNFPRWWINTLVIACFSCVISTLFTLMTSYAFSRMRFKLRQPYMKLILILGMFPGFLGMIAVYNILVALNLNEGILKDVALVMVYSGSAGMGYYVSKGFFDTIPKALDESAKLDGASQAQIFTKITLPLSKPIIVYTALTAFMGPWMDFIFVKMICRGDTDYGTVALGLQTMLEREQFMTHWRLFCAGATMVAVPITVLFMFLQKYYVEGVTGGSVKG